MNLACNTRSESLEYELSEAFLVYKGSDGSSYASVHAVSNGEDGKTPTIQPGKPVVKNALIKALRNLMPQENERPRLFNQNLLAQGLGYMAWWVPPRTLPVWFKCKELGERTAPVPHPGLVFIVSGNKRSIFAIKGKQRPTPETKLYQAPYFNTYSHGGVCEGSTRLPRGDAALNPVAWEESFFRSIFTHPNIHEKNRLVSYEDGAYAFWRDMLDGKFQAFPQNTLVPLNKTLSKVFNEVVWSA